MEMQILRKLFSALIVEWGKLGEVDLGSMEKIKGGQKGLLRRREKSLHAKTALQYRDTEGLKGEIL